MDPANQQQSQFELPPNRPPGDMIPLVSGQAESGPAAPEVASNSGSAAPSLSVPPQASSILSAVQTQSMLPTSPTASSTGSLHPSSPTVANDLDLIEKEWVEKAKAIVAQTKADPYAQNKEMNTFKADYMKKRYNKDIKIEP